MAIRRPSISTPQWVLQDFLYQETPEGSERYIQVKWDGEVYSTVSQTFDYSNPPYSDWEQRGGHIVAQLDYSVLNKAVTVTGWSVNWQDEWPLRVAFNYLTNCLYSSRNGFLIGAVGKEVYKPDGTPVRMGVKDPYAFLVSEQYLPLTNNLDGYLFK